MVDAYVSCYLRQGGYVMTGVCNCNCNWGTRIAPHTGRTRAHYRVNLYPGAQNETEMFSNHNETRYLIYVSVGLSVCLVAALCKG